MDDKNRRKVFFERITENLKNQAQTFHLNRPVISENKMDLVP